MPQIQSGFRVLDAEIAAIEGCRAIVPSAHFQMLADRLAKQNGKLIVTGVGKSAIAARKIAATLATCSISSVFVDPIGLFHGELGMVKRGDLVLMVSHSGETEELIRLLPTLIARGCEIYSIIGTLESQLGKMTSAMVTGVVSEPFLKVPTASSAAAVAIGDALAVEAAARCGYDTQQFAENHPGGYIGLSLSGIRHEKEN